MTESQARQQFATAQVKLEKAFAELNQAKGTLAAITGQRASVNAQLTNALSQAPGGAGKPLQADFCSRDTDELRHSRQDRSGPLYLSGSARPLGSSAQHL